MSEADEAIEDARVLYALPTSPALTKRTYRVHVVVEGMDPETVDLLVAQTLKNLSTHLDRDTDYRSSVILDRVELEQLQVSYSKVKSDQL